MNRFIEETARAIMGGAAGAGRATASELLARSQGEGFYDLLYWANRIRLGRVGPGISLCAIVAGKMGLCSEDCAFCGQSVCHRASGGCAGQELSGAQIVAAGERALSQGAESLGIVSSGLGPSDEELERLGPVMRELSRWQKLRICASLGILSDYQAGYLAELGVERYNHNLETSRSFFPQIVSTHSYDQRVATAKAVKLAGMSLCCGGIFGLGESWEDRLDLAQELAELGPDSVPLNFLHPLAGTPLADAQPIRPMEVLRIIAVFRFMLPDARIKVAGGREHNLRDLQSWMFFAGASGCLIGNYLLTSGREADDDLRMLGDLEAPVIGERMGLGDEVKA